MTQTNSTTGLRQRNSRLDLGRGRMGNLSCFAATRERPKPEKGPPSSPRQPTTRAEVGT